MLLKHWLFLATCTALINLSVAAQNHNREFKISLPETKITGSLYNKITFLDSRPDTTQIGIVQTGAFNRKANVVAKIPLPNQLTELMAAIVDSTAKEGVLLLQLRQLSFAEITGSVSEKGYFYFRANLYAKNGNSYLLLNSIDSAIILKSSWDVTKGLFKTSSKIVSDFISNALLLAPASTTSLSLSSIAHIDSIEKSTVKIYTSTNWQNGIFLNWNTFKNQLPDKPILTAEIKDGMLKNVKTSGEDNKPEKVKSKKIYAIVYNGQPFVATEYGYYPIEKINNDLFFTGKAQVTASTGDVIAASFFFGIMGGLLASGTEAVFDMKIDHLNGGFIRLREIKTIIAE